MKIFSLILPLSIMLSFGACSVNNFAYLEKNDKKSEVIQKVDDSTYKKDSLFEWKISKGDRVEIQAFNQASSSFNGQLTQLLSSGGQKYYTQKYGDEGILINADGLVRLPLVGSVSLLGLTEDEAAQLLMKKYKLYLKHPYVVVSILNQKLFVLGEVKKPGVVLVTHGTMNLFEALARSGDLTDYANRTNIKILRGNMRNPEVREINLNDFDAIRYASLVLRPNDIIYVAPRENRSSMVGANEQLPFWQLIGQILAPFSTAAIMYGVYK